MFHIEGFRWTIFRVLSDSKKSSPSEVEIIR